MQIMRIDKITLQGTTRWAVQFVVMGLALAALMFSGLSFISCLCYESAMRALDDPETEQYDVIDLHENSLSAYDDALEKLDYARRLAPLSAEYEKISGELNLRMDLWRDAMLQMGAAVPDSMLMSDKNRRCASRHLWRSVRLDPANAGLRLELGRFYSATEERVEAREQLMRAVELYPVNAELRFAVARQFLMLGMFDDALFHANILASTDDSYRLEEGDPGTVLARERRMASYKNMLSSSYLFKALEIIWRASLQDLNAIRTAVPDNADAAEVARLFEELYGIEGDPSK